jgi:SAM-dependent methyltransferase
MFQSVANDRDAYLEEYSAEDTIRKYVTRSAGKGIQYILRHVYGPLYAKIIDSINRNADETNGFRVLEYGCGAGMNLLYIVRLLSLKGIPLAAAIGCDFSMPLIQAAEREKDLLIGPESKNKITFLQASNESLLNDIANGLSMNTSLLTNTFDLVVGVNTFRYAVNLHKQQACANDIASLLAPGGYSIMIDMNNRFPLFKSTFRDWATKPKSQYVIPSLDEYVTPFREAKLETVEARRFCWVPHSAGRITLIGARTLGPFLDLVAPGFAMRSLVIARKKS